MGTKPFPNIREAFSEVRQEESQKKLMMGSQNSAPNLKGSALAAQGPQNNVTDNRQRKGRPWCDHCRKPGHLREICWKIHGKPSDWKPSRSNNDREGRINVAATSGDKENCTTSASQAENSSFTKEQLEVLQSCLARMS